MADPCPHETWTPTLTVVPHPHPLAHAQEMRMYQADVQVACATCGVTLTWQLLVPASATLYQDVAVLDEGQTVRLSGRVVAVESEPS
jgi:hypothetical protein